MLSDTMYNIHAFRHLYTVRMHMLCKYCFVRIVIDLFAGPFNCLNFSLELCVCACARVHACVCVCLLLSLLFFPSIVHFCYVYEVFLLKTI